MVKQFEINKELEYYSSPQKVYRKENPKKVNTLLTCTAGADWKHYFRRKDVLELGAGECTYIPYIMTETKPTSYIASDIFEFRFESARNNLRDRFDNLEFRVLRADELNVPDTSFDVILALGLYHHIPNLKKAFMDAYKTLRRGGILIFRDPYAGNPAIIAKYLLERSSNEWPLTVSKCKHLLNEVGFKIEYCKRFWLRFPMLPGGPWSTNIGFVARKEL